MNRTYILATLISTQLYAQEAPPQPVFIQSEVMSEARAYSLITYTRDEAFWGKAFMFDGKTLIEPRNADEKNEIPIPRNEALLLVLAGSFAGELARCSLDDRDFGKKYFRPFWGRYREERQIVFASTLMGIASADVQIRRKKVTCSEKEREALSNLATLINKDRPDLSIQGTSASGHH